MSLPSNQPELLTSQRHHFSLPEEVSYLNCAYMSPLSNEVINIGQQGLIKKARPYQILPSEFFEPVDEVKHKFASLLDVRSHEHISVIPSVSYGFATVAKNLKVKPGQNLVITGEQFPSNVYCWHRVSESESLTIKTIDSNPFDKGIDWSQQILDAIDADTALVSMGILHWANGTVFDIKAIREKTWSVGAKLVLDGTQAIGAMPFSVTSLQPDALICAAYKWLMGPYSLALAYFGPGFDDGIPLEENWINRLNSDDFRNQVSYQSQYRPHATRYDMGEKSNFISLPMLSKSISQVLEWKPERIQNYCRSICDAPLRRLHSLGFTTIDSDKRAAHLFALAVPDNFNSETVDQLLRESKVYVSFRGDSIRVSPHVYNTPNDLDKLVDCLKQGLG